MKFVYFLGLSLFIIISNSCKNNSREYLRELVYNEYTTRGDSALEKCYYSNLPLQYFFLDGQKKYLAGIDYNPYDKKCRRIYGVYNNILYGHYFHFLPGGELTEYNWLDSGFTKYSYSIKRIWRNHYREEGSPLVFNPLELGSVNDTNKSLPIYVINCFRNIDSLCFSCDGINYLALRFHTSKFMPFLLEANLKKDTNYHAFFFKTYTHCGELEKLNISDLPYSKTFLDTIRLR